MKRREFFSIVCGATAAPLMSLAAHAQSDQGPRRVGAMVTGTDERDAQANPWTRALRQGLRDLGWIEGRNLQIDLRWIAGEIDRARAVANELVALKPDVLFAGNTPSVVALMRETREIPIIFANLNDPVGSGVVTSLARPGGNATGFAAFEYSLGSKWLEILKELAPGIRRVAVLFSPDTTPYAPLYLKSIEAAAAGLSLKVAGAPVRTGAEIEQAMAATSREPGSSLIVLPDAYTNSNRRLIIASAERLRLPAIYAFRIQALDGGLVSYGPETSDLYRRAAGYVDRILKGEKPGDLPVQHPIRYELVINLKTARSLGLEVPTFFQQRADEVIE